MPELVPEPAREVARMQVWAEDPFALGSYSALDAAAIEALPALQARHDRLVFAGEHTADSAHTGTMEGALRSVRRAAEQIAAIA